jgi:hypothetical protein
VYPKLRASHVLAVVLALVPFAYLVRLCLMRVVDLPLWDEWALLPRLDHLSTGALTVSDFWGQHNEHRPAFPIAVLLILARLTGWDTRWESAINMAALVAIFAVYIAYLRTAWRAHGGAPLWLVPTFSLLLFSPVQWENFIWGWQFTLMLCALASTVAAYVAARESRHGRFGGAMACAVVATFSFAAGLSLWAVHAAGTWIAGGPRRAARVAIWIGAGAITYAAYFQDFHRWQPPMIENFRSLHAIRTYVQFVFTQLGTPIAGYDARLAALAGAAALAAFVGLAIHLRHLRDDPVYLFPLLVGLPSVATAAISGVGRAFLGVEHAMSSRYTTLTLPLWCAVISLAVLWRSTAPPPAARPRRQLAVSALAVSLLLVTLGSAVKATRGRVAEASATSEVIMYLRRGVLTGKSDALLLKLFPVLDEIRARRAVAMRLRVSVFRPSAQPSYPLPGPE